MLTATHNMIQSICHGDHALLDCSASSTLLAGLMQVECSCTYIAFTLDMSSLDILFLFSESKRWMSTIPWLLSLFSGLPRWQMQLPLIMTWLAVKSEAPNQLFSEMSVLFYLTIHGCRTHIKFIQKCSRNSFAANPPVNKLKYSTLAFRLIPNFIPM